MLSFHTICLIFFVGTAGASKNTSSAADHPEWPAMSKNAVGGKVASEGRQQRIFELRCAVSSRNQPKLVKTDTCSAFQTGKVHKIPHCSLSSTCVSHAMLFSEKIPSGYLLHGLPLVMLLRLQPAPSDSSVSSSSSASSGLQQQHVVIGGAVAASACLAAALVVAGGPAGLGKAISQ